MAVRVTGAFCATDDPDEARAVLVLMTAGITFTETAAEVEALRPIAPEYAAVTELVPTGRADVEIVAVPDDNAADPSEVAPS